MITITAAAEQPTTTLQTIATIVGILTGIGGVLGGVGYGLRKTATFILRIVHFLDDWQGEDARPGQDERPGVLKRLAAVEDATTANALAVAAVSEQLGLIAGAVGELQANGGSTLFDAIHRIEADTATQAGRPVPAPASTHAPTGGTP